MMWTLGDQCGGTGETRQHDDWNGWHREQMWVIILYDNNPILKK